MKTDLDKLKAIIEASKKLTSILDLDELLNVILDVALTELEAERGTVFLLDREMDEIFSHILRGDEIDIIRLPIGKGIAGTVAQTGKTIIIDDAYADSRFDPEFDRKSGFRTRTILALPLFKGDEILGVLQLLNKKTGSFTAIDAEYLSALAAHMVIALENAKAHRERIEQERTRKELELAAQIQHRLLPQSLPGLTDVEMDVTYIPCYSVGGDIYDFIRLPDNRLGIVLADVSGKGIPAAIITSALHAYMHALADSYYAPAEFCSRLNDLLFQSVPASKYATLFFMEIDEEDKTLRYCNCGHNPPLLKSNGSVTRLESTGRVLGLLDGAVYHDVTIKHNRGDMLLIYTDGVSEAAREEDDEEFGIDSIVKAMDGHTDTASGLLKEIYNDVVEFTQREEFDDDLTMLAFRFE